MSREMRLLTVLYFHFEEMLASRRTSRSGLIRESNETTETLLRDGEKDTFIGHSDIAPGG
jgi:hypothetical protein